eukprot:scaffold84869_cov50-Phaeocystis_antarctica.AAC.1
MRSMFWVRSSPCPAPNLQSSPPLRAACTAIARRLPPPGTLHLAPHRMPSSLLSAARVCVQPAAEFRYLQRHEDGRHICGALRACPLAPQPSSRALPMRAACAATAPTPSRLPSRRAPRPASYALLLTCRAHPPCPTPTS